MPLIVVQHRISDFDAWKKAFDSDPLGRTRNGVRRHAIYRVAGDPETVVVHLEFASRDEADHYMTLLRRLWDRVGREHGFGGARGVRAWVLDEVERLEHSRRAG